MDNSEFLSYFNSLSDANPKETILSSASSILSILPITSDKEISNKEKYKLYLTILQKPSEDILYTIRRIVGGITSTSIEFRKGFGLLLSMILKKYETSFNMTELLTSIQKESFVPKNEKGYIKMCSQSGKIILYKILLECKTLSADNLLYIIKEVLFISKTKSLEESVIVLLSDLFEKIYSGYYDAKKQNKLFEGLYKMLGDHICENKNKLNKINNNLEFAIYFILIQYKENTKGFLPTNIVTELFDNNLKEIDSPIKKYFDIVLNLPIKDKKDFNVSFTYLLKCLENLKEKKYAYKIWNILTDPKCIESFKSLSNKNFELLFYNYSIFLINKFFDINYVTQIFDSTFFLSLLKFNTNQKTKYANEISKLIIDNLTSEKNNNKELSTKYYADLIRIFGEQGHEMYSPNTLKQLFIFLLNNMDSLSKQKYINNLLNSAEEMDKNEESEDSIETVIFKISALKIIFLCDNNLDTEYKNKILNHFIILFINANPDDDLEFSRLVDERTLLLILSLIKPTVVNGEVKNLSSSKCINILNDFHKNNIQKLIKDKKIVIEGTKYVKTYKKLMKEEKDDIKYKLLNKLGLILLIFYFKYEDEFQQEIDDVLNCRKFEEGWDKIFTELILNILHKGNNTLSEFSLGIFKKMSKYLGKGGIEVVGEFLKNTKIRKEKGNKYESDENEENEEEEKENENDMKD